jgi:hypothetical protein
MTVPKRTVPNGTVPDGTLPNRTVPEKDSPVLVMMALTTDLHLSCAFIAAEGSHLLFILIQ